MDSTLNPWGWRGRVSEKVPLMIKVHIRPSLPGEGPSEIINLPRIATLKRTKTKQTGGELHRNWDIMDQCQIEINPRSIISTLNFSIIEIQTWLLFTEFVKMDNFMITLTLLPCATGCGSQCWFADVKTIKIIASCRGFYYCCVPYNWSIS